MSFDSRSLRAALGDGEDFTALVPVISKAITTSGALASQALEANAQAQAQNDQAAGSFYFNKAQGEVALLKARLASVQSAPASQNLAGYGLLAIGLALMLGVV